MGCATVRESGNRRAQRLAVVLAGPGAGFLLCGLVMLLDTVFFGISPAEHVQMVASIVGLDHGPARLLTKIECCRFGNERGRASLMRLTVSWFRSISSGGS